MALKLTIMPVIGEVKHNRLQSLTGCHAIYERRLWSLISHPNHFNAKLIELVKELMLADRTEATVRRKLTYIIEVELES